MPHLSRPLLAALIGALSGCVSVTPRVLAADEADPLLASAFPSETPATPLLIGAGLGLQAFGGAFGLEGGVLSGTARGTDAAGQEADVRVTVRDANLILGYPVALGSGPMVLPGVEWIYRSTEVRTTTGTGERLVEGSAFVVRPRVGVAVPVGPVLVTPSVGVDVPVLSNDVLADRPEGATRAGFAGWTAGLTVQFGCDC